MSSLFQTDTNKSITQKLHLQVYEFLSALDSKLGLGSEKVCLSIFFVNNANFLHIFHNICILTHILDKDLALAQDNGCLTSHSQVLHAVRIL